MIQLSLFDMSAQNLENSFGGFKTNFQLFSDTTNLNPTNQIIIQRAEKKHSVILVSEPRGDTVINRFILNLLLPKILQRKNINLKGGVLTKTS